MGVIERVRCGSCGQSWECKTGCGMLHGKLDTVLDAFSEEIKQEVRKQVGQQMFPRFQFAYKPACCENCKAVVTVPVLELTKLDMKYIGGCRRCQSKIEPINVNEMRCPVCHEQQLEIEKVGMWD